MISRKYVLAVAVLTLLGGLLRVGALWDGQLTHDELSALGRLGHESLADLVRMGVLEDGHPAGVQVFLWLWTRLFGLKEWVVRLPFVLMGVACVPLMARVARQWLNDKAAVWCAAVMAFTQYAIYYSVVARPYVFGLFAVLLMLCCWSPVVLGEDSRWKTHIGMAFGLALCAYTHQFAMMAAALIAVAGLVCCAPTVRRRYLISCLLSFLLFVPHLPITWHQLQMGGIGGWLGKPGLDFGWHYLMYLMHFSWLALVSTIAVVILSGIGEGERGSRRWPLLATLGLLPIVVGFCYSVWVEPVLQYSCLIFSWPFLVMLAACRFRSNPSRYAKGAVAIWLVVMPATYFVNRHPIVHKQQPFETCFRRAADGGPEAFLYANIDSVKMAYYATRYPTMAAELPTNSFREGMSLAELDSLCRIQKGDRAVFACIDPYQEAVVRHYYPDGRCLDLPYSRLYVAQKAGIKCLESEVIAQGEIAFDASEEFVPLVDGRLDTLISSRNSLIKVEVDYEGDAAVHAPMLVMETLRMGHKVDYHCVPLDKMPWKGRALLVRNMAELVKDSRMLRFFSIKAYLWNPDHGSNAVPLRYSVAVEPGNRNLFSVTERID